MEEIRRAYGDMAEQYEALFGSIATVHPDDLAMIGRHLSVGTGTVLDVGCGPGRLTDYLCSLGVDATGIDMVPEFIDHARSAFPNGRYELTSMQNLPAADQSLAGILAWYSLIHFSPEQLDDVLAEFRRAMAHGGRMVVGFFNGDEVEPFDHKVVTGYHWPADQMSARLLQAGFSELERLVRQGSGAAHRSHGALAATLR